MARQHGPVVQLWPGTILMSGPDEAEALLGRTGRDFDRDRNFLNQAMDTGRVTWQEWRACRRVILAAMNPGMVSQHMGWVTDRADSLIAAWLARGSAGAMGAELREFSCASIARFCFGSREVLGVADATIALNEALFSVFAGEFVLPNAIRALRPREWRLRRALSALHQAIVAAIGRPGSGGLVETAIRYGLAENAMIAMLTSVHLAASMDPPAALSWALVELARHPGQQQTAAEAAGKSLGAWPAPAEVHWIVDETLRLWPTTWMTDRVAVRPEPTSCGDWVIPAQSRVVVPMWVIHRTAPCFADAHPEEFDSLRWAQLSASAAGSPRAGCPSAEFPPTGFPSAGSYLPFSYGARSCVGARLAQAEMATTLTALLRRARFTVRGPVRPDPRRTLTPEDCELAVAPR